MKALQHRFLLNGTTVVQFRCDKDVVRCLFLQHAFYGDFSGFVEGGVIYVLNPGLFLTV